MSEIEYELFAIRYATRDAQRSAHFIGGDPHDGPMPMDYFVWVARGGGRTFVIDTGFNAEVSARRKRTFLRCPVEGLAALGIDADDGRGCHPHPPALRPCRQFRPLSEGAVSSAGARDGLCHRALHALSAAVAFVRGRGRLRHGAAELCAARAVLRRRRRACAGPDRACGGRPFGRAAIRAGQDRAAALS